MPFSWLSTFIIILLPFSLVAQGTHEDLTTLWKVKEGWWSEMTSGSKSDTSSRLELLLSSLSQLKERVPEEYQETVLVSVERIALNIERFQVLRSSTGWEIEPAPVAKDKYSIADLFTAAEQLRRSDSDYLDMAHELKRLEGIYSRALIKVDHARLSYTETAKRSLQRTLAGLDLLIAITNRAILEERVRVTKEQIAGAEQRGSWNRQVLSNAKLGVTADAIDAEALSRDLQAAMQRERKLELELIEGEAELVASGSFDNFDSRPLLAVQNLLNYSRARAQVYAAQAKQGLLAIFSEGFNSEDAAELLGQVNRWTEGLDTIENQLAEWDSLVRREHDSAERALLRDKAENGEANAEAHKGLEEHQILVHHALVELDTLALEVFQAQQLVDLLSDRIIQKLHWFKGVWRKIQLSFREAFQTVGWILAYPIVRLNEQPLTLLKILLGSLVLISAYWGSIFLQKTLNQFVRNKPHISNASLYTFNRVTHYTILSLGVIWALSTIGIDFSSLLIIAGALSVGIGFGLQGIVNNFLGGLVVLFDRKLRVGDFIELSGGEQGNITEVNVQNTVIRTLRGHDILVPNSDIITRQLTNWTLRDQFSRFHISFGVAYGTDIELVKQVVSAVAVNVTETVIGHRTIPDPTVWLVGFGDSSLDFELVVWIDFRKSKKRDSSITAAYTWEIAKALNEAGIEIPFPQRDLHLKSGALNLEKGGE